MGADVIKVESPKGDPRRKLDSEITPGHNAFYFGVNRSKSGLVLDEDLFEKTTSTEWIAKLAACEVPVAPVNSLAEADKDPQTVHNGSVVELTHPTCGPYPVVQNPVRLSATPILARGYATEPGEHSVEVLRELGIADATIDDLLNRGIVQSSPCP